MSISITVRRYLDAQDVRYSNIKCSVDKHGQWQDENGDISPCCVAKAMILKDTSGLVMVVLPVAHRLKLDALNRQLHRKLRPAADVDYRDVFSDCSPGILPALGEAYSFETVIDDSLLDQEHVYIASGDVGELVQITGRDFNYCTVMPGTGTLFPRLRNNVQNKNVLHNSKQKHWPRRKKPKCDRSHSSSCCQKCNLR